MLNKQVYEVLRWLVILVIPAFNTFFVSIAKAWEWDIPVEAVVTTVSAFDLLLGSVFGISKVVNDTATETAPTTSQKRKTK